MDTTDALPDSTGSPKQQKFTPGPWQALDGMWEIQIWSQVPYDTGDGSGMGNPICDIGIEDLSAEELELARADAALIAAAPDLLAALQDAVAYPVTGEWHAKAVAAIAKATRA